MRFSFVAILLSAASIHCASAMAAHYELGPGETKYLGGDSVSCRSGSGGREDVFVLYHWADSCEKNEDVLARLPIDWSSKENTLQDCKRRGLDNTTAFSYRIGTGPCVRQTVLWCSGIVDAIFGR